MLLLLKASVRNLALKLYAWIVGPSIKLSAFRVLFEKRKIITILELIDLTFCSTFDLLTIHFGFHFKPQNLVLGIIFSKNWYVCISNLGIIFEFLIAVQIRPGWTLSCKKTIVLFSPEFFVHMQLGKVHIFWEGHKILQNLPLTFVLCCASQK